MKKIVKLFPVFLIILGSFLECLYYTKRFTNDGIELYLAIVIGISLTLFLSLLMLKRDKPTYWFMIIPLALYSIMATSAGQSFSLSELHNETVKSEVQEVNRQAQIDEYMAEIDRINGDLDTLNNQISITTIWERNKYESVMSGIEERQDKLNAEKRDLQDKINSLRASQETTTELQKETTNIYQFYHNLFSINADSLQFFLQTVLSFFIACMSPIGIILLTNEKKDEIKEIKKKKSLHAYIARWVYIALYKIGNNTSDKIIPRSDFLKWMRPRYKSGKESLLFTEKIYDKLFSLAIEKNILDKNGVLIYHTMDLEKIIQEMQEEQ